MKKFFSLISVVLIVAMFFVGCDGINVNINGDVNGNMNGNVNAGQNGGTTQVPNNTPTEKPTEEPTEVTTQETTESPTQETTEAPTQETTEKPKEENTEAPIATRVTNAHVVKEEGRFRFTFSMVDKDQNEIVDIGSVKIKIVNESGITVYEATEGINANNYATWYWGDGSGSFLGASVYVYRDDIMPSVAARGTFYFTVMSREDSILQEVSHVVAYELPQTPFSEDEEIIAISDAINLALMLPNRGNASEVRYLIEGTVVSIDHQTYGNMYVTDGEGNTIYVYGLYEQDGTRFDSMEKQPAPGDKVLLYGILINYDKAEMKNAWLISCETPGEKNTEEEITTAPEEITTAPEEENTEVTDEEIEIPAESVVLSCGGNYVSGDHYYYENPNNASIKKWELAMVASTEQALAFNMVKNNDGSIYIKSGDMYLWCNGNDVTFVSQPDEYAKFYLENTESGTGYFIRTSGKHGENYQYLEVYMGYLTCYTMQSEKANIYTFTFESAKGAAGTIVGCPNT